MGFYTEKDERIAELQAEVERLREWERAIPVTFYAGASPVFRLTQLVRIWQNAVKANAELEAKLAEVKPRVLLSDFDAQVRRADKAEDEVARLRGLLERCETVVVGYDALHGEGASPLAQEIARAALASEVKP